MKFLHSQMYRCEVNVFVEMWMEIQGIHEDHFVEVDFEILIEF